MTDRPMDQSSIIARLRGAIASDRLFEGRLDELRDAPDPLPFLNELIEAYRAELADLREERDELRARVVEPEQRKAVTVTSHTFEGAPGPGRPCQAEAFGETCGATWEQHEMREPCPHADTWFDRTVCPEPCGGMHDRCTNCGESVGRCAFDGRIAVDNSPTSTNAVDNSSSGYADTSDRNPDGTCPDWCPCHKLKE